jgi:hypothetical protein
MQHTGNHEKQAKQPAGQRSQDLHAARSSRPGGSSAVLGLSMARHYPPFNTVWVFAKHTQLLFNQAKVPPQNGSSLKSAFIQRVERPCSFICYVPSRFTEQAYGVWNRISAAKLDALRRKIRSL